MTDVTDFQMRNGDIPANAAVNHSESGQTVIHEQVIAKIIGIAVREVEGVHKSGRPGASSAHNFAQAEMNDPVVQVEIRTNEILIHVRISTVYGASILSIAEAIRRDVTERVHSSSGLRVTGIDIDVVDLYFPDEDVDMSENHEPAPAGDH